ncbi:MAG: ComF family protein [Clostridia bacterium]|nr:ComF family protein [Clostridia bacterium]
MLEYILDLIFPPKCVFCHSLLDGDDREKRMCSDCSRTLIPSVHTIEGEFFDKGCAAYIYSGKVRESLHRFKFGGRKEYASVYAELLIDTFGSSPIMNEAEIIVSVPTNGSNIRKRGYDHTGLLARKLAEKTSVGYAAALRKTRKTKPMFGLKPNERKANILGSIEVRINEEQIRGKTVLLIDDIFTTGATASECARVLKQEGAEKVFVITVAKTEKSY